MVNDVCLRLEGDLVLDSLRNDNQLEEYRTQRLKEIVLESFSFE